MNRYINFIPGKLRDRSEVYNYLVEIAKDNIISKSKFRYIDLTENQYNKASALLIEKDKELDFICEGDGTLINSIAEYLKNGNKDKILRSIQSCAIEYYKETIDEIYNKIIDNLTEETIDWDREYSRTSGWSATL